MENDPSSGDKTPVRPTQHERAVGANDTSQSLLQQRVCNERRFDNLTESCNPCPRRLFKLRTIAKADHKIPVICCFASEFQSGLKS